MINLYVTSCALCGCIVNKGEGEVFQKGGKTYVTHVECPIEDQRDTDAYDAFEYDSYNSNRCEDAPCCGCC